MNKLKDIASATKGKVNQALETTKPASQHADTSGNNPWATETLFEEEEKKNETTKKEEQNTKSANNQLLLALNVTKLKMHEWGFVGRIIASIQLGVIELHMSIEKSESVQRVDNLEAESESIESQLTEAPEVEVTPGKVAAQDDADDIDKGKRIR